jgi:hypothetical protein
MVTHAEHPPSGSPGAENDEIRRRRVECVLGAANRLLAPGPARAQLVAELRQTTGLSTEGVARALDRHAERSASEHELALLLGRTRRPNSPPTCHVLLSANVCTGSIRALCLAVAVAPHVRVRPSRRDPALAVALAAELSRDRHFARASGTVELVGELVVAPEDELHAYGRDDTIAAVRTLGCRVWAFGSGYGIAVVEEGIDLAAAANAIVSDVVAFDQRGCLSPRVVLCGGDAERASQVATILQEHLARAASEVPMGTLAAAERAEVARWLTTAAALGGAPPRLDEVLRVGAACSAEDHDAIAPPPPARCLHVVGCGSGMGERTSAVVAKATILGGGGGAVFNAARALAPRARVAALGRMQTPPLDGPVDLRTAPDEAVERPGAP